MGLAKLPFTLVSWCDPRFVVEAEEEMAMVLTDKTFEGLRTKMIQELIEMAGGPEMAARRLAEREVPEVDTAITLLGGIQKAADKLGMTRSNLWKMLQRAPVDWNGRWIKALSDKSRIPAAMLLESRASELVKRQPELTVVKPEPNPKKRVKKSE